MTPSPDDAVEVPFEAFFEALGLYGVHPTLGQMRQFSAVLGHEADWDWEKIETVALAIFGSTRSEAEAVHEAIRVVRKTTARRPLQKQISAERRKRRRPTEAPRRDWFVNLAVILLLGAGVLAFVGYSDAPAPNRTPSPDPVVATPEVTAGSTVVTTYCPGRACRAKNLEQRADDLWVSTIALSALTGTLSVLVLAYLLHCPLRRLSVSDNWVQPGTRFLVDRIGPPRQGVVGEAGADKIANLFVDRDNTINDRQINPGETVRATARNAGMPEIVQATRNGARRLLVIEDSADPLKAVLGFGDRLVDLLERRGVETDIATASTTLEACSYRDGTPVSVMQRIRDRQTIVVLVMEDRILRQSPLPLIQTLFKTPAAIWLDPRLPKTKPTCRLMIGGLIQAPVTEGALVTALEGTHGLRALASGTLVEANTARADDPYLQLGDALPLALAASQLQPMSINLLDLLRRRHFRHLEPLDLLRLARTAGVVANGSSLRFAPALQRRLCRDFDARFDEAEQRAIAATIMEALSQGRPGNVASFAFAAWEAHFRQVQLNLDPDTAIAALSRLARSGLGEGIRQRLEAAGKIAPADVSPPMGTGGRLQAALNHAQIGPLPLSSATWWVLYVATGFLVILPALMIGLWI